MAPFWEQPVKRIFKRSKKHDRQAGYPPETIAGPGSNSDKSNSAASSIVHSTTCAQKPPATVSSTSSPHATTLIPTVCAPRPCSSGSATSIPSSLRESLWNQAYDDLKVEEPALVDAYERILSSKLSKGESSSADLEPPKNDIEQENPEKRRSQMMRLIQAGLDKTEKEAAVKQGIEDGMQVVHSLGGIIDKAVKAAPEAALAWVGLCFVVEIIANPISEAVANRSGLNYVVSRMDWYWNLSDLLLDKNRVEKSSAGLRDELEKHVIDLYKRLLAYQMASVYSYHRNRGIVFLRDMIRLDDWDGRLKSIKQAEDIVEVDSSQYNALQIRSHLRDLVITAGSAERKLQDINLAIQRQTMQHSKMQEEEEFKKCLKDLRLTNPDDDKTRIEQTKGGLLQDSYGWILENADFQQWRDDDQSRLLWIKGDPGKGKTMLLCGIVDELKKSAAETGLLSYFFCQGTDSRINNATAVLRGLIYLLVNQQPSLISHVRKKYDYAGKALFEDANAWVALSEIFTNILQDTSLKSTYLVIDALDECVTDLPKLLDFIVQRSSSSPRVKWIVSSRNWPNIEERLEKAGCKVRLCLELNSQSVSTAVGIYIQHKVFQLAQLKKYDNKMRDAVLAHLSANASDTFLWVALVCRNLETISRWNILEKLNTFPPGLDSLYERMMEQIRNSDDANLCKRILSSISVVYQPITLKELTSLVEMPENVVDNRGLLMEIIGLCGSFLAVREDTIYFVHQSAKDFLYTMAFHEIFPSGIEEAHYVIFSRSLQVMSRTLRRDMYSLRALGYPIERVNQPNPDPLASSRYSCIYWVDHLCDWNPNSSANHGVNLQDGGAVDTFVRQKYLYWLEALSLCKCISEGVVSMAKLKALLQGRANANALIELVEDAHRFIMYHKSAIQDSPLQAYASALVFSPARSLIRCLFKKEEPNWITIKPVIGDRWSACLQTLEGHSDGVKSVAFSHDSARLASGSSDDTIKIWDASSGECLQTLKGHSNSVSSVAFSHDSARLASGSCDTTIKIWDASSGECLQTLKGHSDWVNSAVFSHDSAWLASGSSDNTVKIWGASSGECLQTLDGHSHWVTSVAFSHDSARLASGSNDKTVKIWDVSSGERLQTLEVRKAFLNLSFDCTGSYVHTENGTLIIDASSLSSMARRVTDPQNSRYQGVGLSSCERWITHNSENLVWLPSEYRPPCSAVSGKAIGVGVGSGKVWICNVELDES